MQENIIENFITLTKLSHCSRKTEELFNFIINFSKERDYQVEVDTVKNILIKKGNPSLALQAHYDMVCMGKAPQIETYVKEGWMYAKDSSLGADNGMAIAMMMELMEEGRELEFLLTADEEIGLVGATGIELELSSKYMLNLDFEDEGIVCIGCAGGVDILGKKVLYETEGYTYNYELTISGLPGGHSGVEIHKNIPNAIKVMADFLKNKSVLISSFIGGERRNSIPTNVQVKLSSEEVLESTEWIQVKQFDEPLKSFESDDLVSFIQVFNHGIDSYNEEFNLADSSINLALIHCENGVLQIDTSARAMSAESLEEISEKNIQLFIDYGFNVEVEDKYGSWKPEVNEFTKSVKDAMISVYGKSHYEAIHAGLECGVLLERYPYIKFASIGPTIVSPHTTHEKVHLASVEKIFNVVQSLIDNL